MVVIESGCWRRKKLSQDLVRSKWRGDDHNDSGLVSMWSISRNICLVWKYLTLVQQQSMLTPMQRCHQSSVALGSLGNIITCGTHLICKITSQYTDDEN